MSRRRHRESGRVAVKDLTAAAARRLERLDEHWANPRPGEGGRWAGPVVNTSVAGVLIREIQARIRERSRGK